MKLLFDANLSRRIVPLLEIISPVRLTSVASGWLAKHPAPSSGNRKAEWIYQRHCRCRLSAIGRPAGCPPQVVRLHRMDYTTEIAAQQVRCNAIAIAEFERSAKPVLVLRKHEHQCPQLPLHSLTNSGTTATSSATTASPPAITSSNSRFYSSSRWPMSAPNRATIDPPVIPEDLRLAQPGRT